MGDVHVVQGVEVIRYWLWHVDPLCFATGSRWHGCADTQARQRARAKATSKKAVKERG